MDNWDDLKFVLAIAKAGTLSAASRHLGVTHSTVSRRLSALEANMGSRLFERLAEGLKPTSAGLEAVDSARRIEAELHDLDTRITARDTTLEGPLRVTAAQLMFQAGLADIIADFAAQNPQIEVSMNAANEILSLRRREADVAVRVSDRPDEGLFGRLATGQRRGFYASQAFLRRHDEALNAAEGPAAIPCVAFKWWGKLPPREIRARFPNAYTAVVSDDMIAVHSAVRAGMGIGRLPCFLGDPDPELARVPGFELMRYFDIWVLTHPDLKNVERIRRFVRFAADGLKAKSGLFMGE